MTSYIWRDTARLPLSLLDEVAEERGAWRKRHMVDVAVQGLVHSEHELSHTHFLSFFPYAAHPRGSELRYAVGCTDAYVPAILTQNRLRAPGFYSFFTTTAVAGTQAERIYAYDSALAWPRLACSVDRLTNGVQM